MRPEHLPDPLQIRRKQRHPLTHDPPRRPQQPQLPHRHRPIRNPLVHIRTRQPDQRRMHIVIHVQTLRNHHRLSRPPHPPRLAGHRRRNPPHTRLPQRPRIVPRQTSLHHSTQIIPERRQPPAFLQMPRQRPRLRLPHPRRQHRRPQLMPRQPPRNNHRIRLRTHHHPHILIRNPPTSPVLLIRLLLHVRLRSKLPRRLQHRLLELHVLKRMQRVVVNEHPNRTLRRKIMSGMIDRMAQGLARTGG